MKIINRIGFFRLLLVPLGIVIIVSAIINGIWGMGITGVVVLLFGSMNRCLLLGKCETNFQENSQKK